jgi:hypothetical protein
MRSSTKIYMLLKAREKKGELKEEHLTSIAREIIDSLPPDAAAQEAIRRREWTEEWYASRIERLRILAQEKGFWPEMAAIIANGAQPEDKPPSHSAMLVFMRHRAETAEKELAELKAKINASSAT